MITFQIQLSAKTVKEALKMRADLLEAGISEGMISTPAPSIARAPSFSQAGGEKGPNEQAWIAKYGCGFRTSPKMVAMFGLQGTREETIGQMSALLESGKVVKTATGYQFGNGRNASANTSVELPPDDGGETF